MPIPRINTKNRYHWYFPIHLLIFLFLVALLTRCTSTSAAEFTSDLFQQYEFNFDTTNEQTLLTGFFLGRNSAEIAAIHINENDERHLTMYGLVGEAWVAILETTLGREITFVDVAKIEGRDRIITYQRGALNWFDPESAVERPLLETSAIFTSEEAAAIPQVDITRDVNHDGRDDLLLPDIDGFWLSTQLSDGSFSDSIKLGPGEPLLDQSAFGESRTYREVGLTALSIPAYLSRVHELDYNRDGRNDLVFWNENHFEVYYQYESGEFDSPVEIFTTTVPFDADGIYSINFAFKGESLFSLITGLRPKTRFTVLHSFIDMNGDGVKDLVTQSVEGRSALNQSSQFDVHFGSPTANGIVFDTSESMTLRPQGNARGGSPIGYSLGWLQDLNDDGNVDFLFGRVDTGVAGFFRATLASSISIDLEYYQIENDYLPDQPSGSLLIKPDLEFVIGGRGPFFPTVLLGDVNGDDLADLLVGENWQELHVYHGVKGPEVFSKPPQVVRVAMTANEQNARLVDLNNDNKQDLIVHHADAEPNKLIVLIAR